MSPRDSRRSVQPAAAIWRSSVAQIVEQRQHRKVAGHVEGRASSNLRSFSVCPLAGRLLARRRAWRATRQLKQVASNSAAPTLCASASASVGRDPAHRQPSPSTRPVRRATGCRHRAARRAASATPRPADDEHSADAHNRCAACTSAPSGLTGGTAAGSSSRQGSSAASGTSRAATMQARPGTERGGEGRAEQPAGAICAVSSDTAPRPPVCRAGTVPFAAPGQAPAQREHRKPPNRLPIARPRARGQRQTSDREWRKSASASSASPDTPATAPGAPSGRPRGSRSRQQAQRSLTTRCTRRAAAVARVLAGLGRPTLQLAQACA